MNPIPLAPSLSRVSPSLIRELANVAFTMDNVLRLHFGESNLPTPPFIVEAACRALAEGHTFYTENAGIPGLRSALAGKYADLHGVELDPDSQIVVTASGVQALNLAIRCAIDPGDEALILTPNWPNASGDVALYGGVAREVPYTRGKERFEIDFPALEAALSPRTRLLVYTSPSNPLGWVASPSDQERLLAFCRRHGLWLVADEVYERIYYGGPVAPSILRLCHGQDAVTVVGSFSKSYCMTGWRLGWLVSRADLGRKAAQLNEFIVSHAPSMVQRAGEAALAQGEPGLREMVSAYAQRVRFCREALAGLDAVWLPEPEGAFYLFPRIAGMEDSFAFCLRLLRETRVSVAPGVAFGNGGEGYVRICCAADRSVLEPAMERFVRFVQQGG
jgi:hypothetical protein